MPVSQASFSARHTLNADDLPSEFLAAERCLQQSLPTTLGVGYSRYYQLDPGLSYIDTQYSPKQNFSLLSRIASPEPRIVLTLGLEGCSRFVSTAGEEVLFTQGYSAITHFHSSEGQREYAGDMPVRQLRFALSKIWLEQYLPAELVEQLQRNPQLQQLSHHPLSVRTQLAARQLLEDETPGPLKAVMLKGLAMSILATELSPLLNTPAQAIKRFNAKEHNMAKEAHAILCQEFRTPPSVAELATRVGTNQFKLKQLLHYYFHNTPYGLLLDIRMHAAYQLLASTHCHVNLAADFVGYNHSSNFCAAFSKYFAVTPKTVAKAK